MRILISNDDGILAEGIHTLAHAMSEVAEVVVVAPDSQRSGSSHGISLHEPLMTHEVDFGTERITALSVSGTPVDCVKLAIVLLGREKSFDFMLSGINHGTNLATDVLYSGTVAAAGEAALQGIPAIALSMFGPSYCFDEVARSARDLVHYFAKKPFPPDSFLNVNFPNNNVNHAPWRATKLGVRSFKDNFLLQKDARGQISYVYNGDELEEMSGDDADVVALHRGEISITPLQYRFTNELFLDSLKTWL